MADRYVENTLVLAAPDDPPVVREILKAAAVALKVSMAGQLDWKVAGPRGQLSNSDGQNMMGRLIL
jgi:hypothetical protein